MSRVAHLPVGIEITPEDISDLLGQPKTLSTLSGFLSDLLKPVVTRLEDTNCLDFVVYLTQIG